MFPETSRLPSKNKKIMIVKVIVFPEPSETGPRKYCIPLDQGSHRLEKYLSLKAILEKSLKIKSVVKNAVEFL